MGDTYDESVTIYTKYATYDGANESPATPSESALCDCGDDEQEAAGGEGHGRGGKKGLSMVVAAFFLVGEMAGGGVLSLPRALANTWWVGLPLMVVLCVAVGFAGTRLALCWVLLEERWPEYRSPCRRPYPAIALRTLGRPGQMLLEVCLNLTLFGVAVVNLLLATQMLNDLWPVLTPCSWSMVLASLLTPITWFGTPKEFWPASVLAMGATALACLVVVVELAASPHPPPSYPPPSVSSFFLGFGAILFSLGGACLFPSIQNDMRDKTQFRHSVVVTFLVLMSLYLPVSTIGYGLLGSAVPSNVVQAVSGRAVVVTEGFLLCHFLLVVAIVVNPINQTLEDFLSLPAKMGPARCMLRSGLMGFVALVGLAVPEFGKILDLIGGSSVPIMSFVLPPICYLRLASAQDPHGQPYRAVARWERVLLLSLVVVGVVGGGASTWSALSAIIHPGAFSTSCFSKEAFKG